MRKIRQKNLEFYHSQILTDDSRLDFWCVSNSTAVSKTAACNTSATLTLMLAECDCVVWECSQVDALQVNGPVQDTTAAAK